MPEVQASRRTGGGRYGSQCDCALPAGGLKVEVIVDSRVLILACKHPEPLIVDGDVLPA